MMYVVDDETLFFYAGLFDETRQDRKGYRIKAKFNNNGTVTLRQIQIIKCSLRSVKMILIMRSPFTVSLESMDASVPT